MLICAVVAALVLGFLAGLLSFKIKSRWCPQCGATTTALAKRQHSPGILTGTPGNDRQIT